MAEGTFELKEITGEEGVVKQGLIGDLYTFNADIRVEITPEHDEADKFFRPQDVNNSQPSHTVKILSRTGRYIYSGRGWTKNQGKGPNLSVNMVDPHKMNFNVWQENESGEWRVTGGGFS